MHLLENPFHLLGASPRDDRRRILELAEEKSLSMDPSVCSQARAALTNPRNRLAAEVAWLPGLEPGQMGAVVEALQRAATVGTMEGLPALARANLLATAITRMDDTRAASELPFSILELANLLESCDAEKVRALINEERAMAGFPEVREASTVEEALGERRRHYRTSLKNALEVLPPRELVGVITQVVTKATAEGTRHASALIVDLVNTYEVEAQRFLDAEAHNVEQLVQAVRQCVTRKLAPPLLERLLSRIREVVSNWDSVAQPIQLASLSRGQEHELSVRVAGTVRGLAVDLFNEHGLVDASSTLTKLLQETFRDVPRVAELTKYDVQALLGVTLTRDNQKREWERDIHFEGTVGTHPLKISAEGVEWHGLRWPLESITRVRWGGVANPYTGQVELSLTFGNGTSYGSIQTLEQDLHRTLTNKMWRAVGRRLLFEMLTTLGKGLRLEFGDVLVDDFGVRFTAKDFHGLTRYVHAAWSQLKVESANGHLRLWHGDVFTELPYYSMDNVHVLEAAIQNFAETNPHPPRLSDLLR